MAGDLNVKKSWHPGLMRNQEAVWKKEQEALDERKRIAERQREIQEERERAELQALQDGGRKRQERVEWMYNAPQGGNLGVSEEVEAFLMGKNTVEELLRQSESLGTLKEDEEQSFVASGSAAAGVNAKDVAAKVREDPMLVIKKEQQAVINALRNNPDRVAALKSSRSASDRERERARRIGTAETALSLRAESPPIRDGAAAGEIAIDMRAVERALRHTRTLRRRIATVIIIITIGHRGTAIGIERGK